MRRMTVINRWAGYSAHDALPHITALMEN